MVIEVIGLQAMLMKKNGGGARRCLSAPGEALTV